MFASDSAHSPASRLYTPSPTCWRPPADPHQTASSPSASYLQGPAPSPGSGPLWDTQWHVEIFLQIREIHDKPFYPVRNNAYAKCVIVFSIYILQMLNMYHGCFVFFFFACEWKQFYGHCHKCMGCHGSSLQVKKNSNFRAIRYNVLISAFYSRLLWCRHFTSRCLWRINVYIKREIKI